MANQTQDSSASEDDGRRDVPNVEGSKARARLDRPSRKKYADGGAAVQKGGGVPAYPGVPRYAGVPRDPGIKTYPGVGHYASGGEISAPPLPMLRSAPNVASIPTPYADENKTWVVPTLDPAQSFDRYKQTVAQRYPRAFAEGVAVDGKSKNRSGVGPR